MKLGDITDIAVSGLIAQRSRMALVASNVANAETTRTREGGPYLRRDPVFETRSVAKPFSSRLDRALKLVDVSQVRVDSRPPISRHVPGHPDTDAQGFVDFPRINLVEEIADMMSASRSYEANLLIMRKVRDMARAAVEIGR
ncbi:MAG: flagellar basal body rod protein FlgC [Myxococcales bacterium]|nr:flagellar basal body rod protein FlgC [Myxococcales bacterium]